jgi:Flp pilus assembly protein TadG
MNPARRLRWTKLRKCDGAAMVEFAIGSSVLIMLLLGIIEFGLLWYQQQVITNAAREGARYGVTYQTTTAGLRKAPKNMNPSIATVVNNYCTGRIAAGSWTVAPLGGTAATANDGDELHTPPPPGSPPKTIIVKVTCANTMDLLSGFVPALANKTFTAQSTMNCE